MTTNKQRFDEACKVARATSMRPDYLNCGVHVNVRVEVIDGEPRIVAYHISDWHAGDATARTYINGRIWE